MSADRWRQIEDQHLVPSYQRYPVVVVRGSGALLWDAEGREYVDCMGGYGVAIVGHANPRVAEAVKRQVELLTICHGSLYNNVRAEFLEKLVSIAPKGLTRAFLSNSGAEAVEAAIKMARRHTGRRKIVAMKGAFHGKTLGALSLTWGRKYREPFEPLLPDVAFTPFGDIEALSKVVDQDTAALFIEPIQGEGGILLPPDGFLKEAEQVAHRVGALLVIDEIQAGFGRTGRWWAHQHWGVEPDILCAAKGVGGGLPLGVTLAREEVATALKVGEHTSTFGGNPLVCAAAKAAIEYVEEAGLLAQARENGAYFLEGLRRLAAKHLSAREARGLGLILALDLRRPVRDVILGGLREGVILLYAGTTTLRFLPPLVITQEQIDRVLSALDQLLAVEDGKLASSG
jgi:acetylornithine/LysW-gamma-L-lysine aminotransferase